MTTTANGPQTKLQLNDDGTVTVPLKGRNPVVLDEPGALQLADFYRRVNEADEANPIPSAGVRPSNDASRAELEAYAARLQEVLDAQKTRTVAVYAGKDGGLPPYLAVFLHMVNELHDGDPVEPEQLYGWAANPVACRELVNHFTAPLGGKPTE